MIIKRVIFKYLIILFIILITYNNVYAFNIKQLKEGDKAPDTVSVEMLDGKEKMLKFFSNDKPILLWFWATACSGCMSHIRILNNFVSEFKNDIYAIAINLDFNEEREQALNIIKNNLENFKTYFDKISVSNLFMVSFECADKFGVKGLPAILVIDKNGIIRYSNYGIIDLDEIKDCINELIKNKQK